MPCIRRSSAPPSKNSGELARCMPDALRLLPDQARRPIARPVNSNSPSPLSSMPTTPSRNPSNGPNRPMTSSPERMHLKGYRDPCPVQPMRQVLELNLVLPFVEEVVGCSRGISLSGRFEGGLSSAQCSSRHARYRRAPRGGLELSRAHHGKGAERPDGEAERPERCKAPPFVAR